MAAVVRRRLWRRSTWVALLCRRRKWLWEPTSQRRKKDKKEENVEEERRGERQTYCEEKADYKKKEKGHTHNIGNVNGKRDIVVRI